MRSHGRSQLGSKYNSVGIITGFDYAFDHFGLGTSVDYKGTTGSIVHHASHFHTQRLHGLAYGVWPLPSLKELAVLATAGGGYRWISASRSAGSTLAPKKAKKHTRGNEADGLLGAVYICSTDRFATIPEGMLVMPYANGQYCWSHTAGFTEHGAGIYSLHVEGQQVQSLKSTLGVRIDYLIKGKNVTFKPEIDLAWQHEYLNQIIILRSSTIHLPQVRKFSRTIFAPGRNTLCVGVDFQFTLYRVFELELSYDFAWNSAYQKHIVYLGVGGNF